MERIPLRTRRAAVARGLAALGSIAARPSLATSRQARAERAFLRLEASPGRLELAGHAIEVQAFGGAVPGPVIRVRAGENIHVQLANKLEAPLSLHWQGVRIANAMDGVAGLTQPPVPPGASFEYAFAAPDSGTFLYRPCTPGTAHGAPSGGLHGLLVVEEHEPPSVDREFLLAATLWRIDDAGRLAQAGAAGRSILAVNGRTEAETAALPQGARVRLRVANAAASRLLLLAVDGTAAPVIAVDSQPCEPFVPARGVIPLGPGARFDVLIDLPHTPRASVRVMLSDALETSVPPLTAIELVTTEAQAPRRAARAALPANPRLPAAIALERAVRGRLLLATPPRHEPDRRRDREGLAGVVLLPELRSDDPIAAVERGTPVVFALANPAPRPISVHVHGHSMRVLHDLDDGWRPYWRDTVLIEPNKTHHVAFVADNPGKWLVEAIVLAASGSSPRRFAWYEVG